MTLADTTIELDTSELDTSELDELDTGRKRARISNTRRAAISREIVVDTLRLAGRPLRMSEICDRLGYHETLDRKAVANRIGAMLAVGLVRKSTARKGAHAEYSLNAKRGRPTNESRATSSKALAVIVQPQPMSVDDACTGMLLGLTGRDSVPIAALPEIVEWMRHTRALVERLS